ncbi:MAG TPA: DUF1648 domain-containing protein [Terracidiphilus sp.]|nr:DUF1648 domain-containing protein [Terracidiphilus sp.]
MRKTLEAIGLIALIVLLWITYQALAGPNPLPNRIPTHFDASGNPNGWGSPAMLILLPVVAIGLYLGITVVSRIPSAFHYPVRVTRVNLPRIQNLTLDMITWIKTELACLFATLQWWMIQAARNGGGRLPPLLVPGFIVLIFGTIGGYLFAVIRAAASGRDSN